MKKKILALLLLATLLITTIPPALLTLIKLPPPNTSPTTNTTTHPPLNNTITLPIAPGDIIQLTYTLYKIINDTNTTHYMIDQVNLTLKVTEIRYPFVYTNQSVFPITFFFLIKDGNVYQYTFTSYFFHDQVCMHVYPETQTKYSISPRNGCTQMAGVLYVDENKELRTVSMTYATGSEPLLEVVNLNYHIHTGNTTITIVNAICRGPYSPYLQLTAPGLYQVNGTKLLYYGKYNPNKTLPLLIVIDKDTGEDVWQRIPYYTSGTYIFVWSHLTAYIQLKHPAIYVNGTIVAEGEEEVEAWLHFS